MKAITIILAVTTSLMACSKEQTSATVLSEIESVTTADLFSAFASPSAVNGVTVTLSQRLQALDHITFSQAFDAALAKATDSQVTVDGHKISGARSKLKAIGRSMAEASDAQYGSIGGAFRASSIDLSHMKSEDLANELKQMVTQQKPKASLELKQSETEKQYHWYPTKDGHLMAIVVCSLVDKECPMAVKYDKTGASVFEAYAENAEADVHYKPMEAGQRAAIAVTAQTGIDPENIELTTRSNLRPSGTK